MNFKLFLEKNNIPLETICSSANYYQDAEDKAGKRQYQANKKYDPNAKYAILNPSKAYENYGLVIFDIDFPIWEERFDCDFQKAAMRLKELGVAYSQSPYGLKLYLRLDKGHIPDFAKDYTILEKQWSLGDKSKDCVCEILHLKNKHCDFALTNDEGNDYYTLGNVENLFRTWEINQETEEFFEALSVTAIHKKESNTKTIASRQYGIKDTESTEDEIHRKNAKKFNELGKSMKEFLSWLIKRLEIEIGAHNNDGCNDGVRIAYKLLQNPYAFTLTDFKDFLNCYADLHNGVYFSATTLAKKFESKVIVPLKEENPKEDSLSLKQVYVCCSTSTKQYFVLEETQENSGVFNAWEHQSTAFIGNTLGVKPSELGFYRIEFDNTHPKILSCNGSEVTFNRTLNEIAKIPERREWIDNKTCFDDVELDNRTRALFENTYGLNVELAIRKEAFRFGRYCLGEGMDGRSKLKSFDILLSTQRGTGKTSFVELITKIYMPNLSENITDFVGKYPEVNSYNGQIMYAGTITEKSVSLSYDEHGMSKADFEFLKEVQSPMGTSIQKKMQATKTINPPHIYCYVSANYDESTAGRIYYSNDTSLNSSIFLSFNLEARTLISLLSVKDREWLCSSAEAVSNLRKYLLKVFNTLGDEDKDEIMDCSRFVAKSFYRPQEYLTLTKGSKASASKSEYIKALQNRDHNSLCRVINDEILGMLEEKQPKLYEPLNKKVQEYLDGVSTEFDFRRGEHNAICKLFSITASHYQDHFTSKGENGKLKL